MTIDVTLQTLAPALTVIPEGVEPIRFLIIGSLSVMLFGAGKAGFAGGIAILSTPLMLYACAGNESIAPGIMLPLLIAADYVVVMIWRPQWNARQVGMLLPGSVAGIAMGSALLWGFQQYGPDSVSAREATGDMLKLAIGLIALAFVGLQIWRTMKGRLPAFRPSWPHAAGFGAAAGVTSTLAHAAGPVTTMYLLPQQMPKGQYVATSALYYWVLNQMKLVPYFLLGMISLSTLGADLVFLPAVAVGALLGRALHDRISQTLFVRVVYVLLGAIGVDFTVRSILALGGM